MNQPTIGAGIAIAGIWLGAAGMVWASGGDLLAILLAPCFAVMATAAVAGNE